MAWLKETGADPNKLNPNGGAIAIGHPLGASGTRLMVTMMHELERTGGRYGLQTMCEGHGMANATIIERLINFTKQYISTRNQSEWISLQLPQQSIEQKEGEQMGKEIIQKFKETMQLPVILAPMFIINTPNVVLRACEAGIIGTFRFKCPYVRDIRRMVPTN